MPGGMQPNAARRIAWKKKQIFPNGSLPKPERMTETSDLK
jgi:cyclopropane fatty-acyl-phospholipid synthase-like methyltransferase